ncbi:MAG: peptide-methionine (S)-S-oxide reductase MsrA [Bryobacterales bacterium]
MRGKILVAALVAVMAAVVIAVYPVASVAAAIPDPSVDIPPAANTGTQTAVLAGGCFWCTEAVLEQLKGVQSVTSGYAGGKAGDARYDMVAAGKTDHTESIQIVFDPKQITYGQILKVFFGVAHDPTQLNRQGPDWGRQYRSAIFWVDAEQERVAKTYIKQLADAKVFSDPIVTEVARLEHFYEAEAYHQNFVKRHPSHPYVVVNALPKLKKLDKTFPELVK